MLGGIAVQDALNPKRIEEILRNTVDVLQNNKYEMFDIVEAVENEYNRIVAIIAELKHEINQTVNQVEKLERDFRKIRVKLLEVSRNYDHYTEKVKEDIYQQADELRETLAVAREREKNLIKQRTQQEEALINIEQLKEKAEKSFSQVAIALDFLNGNIIDINEQLEGIQVRYQLVQKIIKMQEDERKRLAREIHDGPAQDLANVVIKAEICEQLYETEKLEELPLELGELKLSVQYGLTEIRKIIHNLRPMVLDDLGLVPAVKHLIAEAEEQSGIRFHLSVIGSDNRIDSAIEIAVFRIIQEAINNSRKYAKTSSIKIKLEFLPTQINAVVEDEGIGFDKEILNQKLATGEHFGLYGMRERVELLGGSIIIRSRKGEGTRISVMIPFQSKE